MMSLNQNQRPRPPWRGPSWEVAIFVLSLATFIVILDATIINVAVPHIAGYFAASPSEGTWVITSYAVAEALTVPLSGWIADRFGTVKVLSASMLSFALFSALCGIAPNLETLILFRVLQGLSGGPLIPISQTLIMRICPARKLEAMMGLWMTTSILRRSQDLSWVASWLTRSAGAGPFISISPLPYCVALPGFSCFGIRKRQSGKNVIDYVGLALLCIWVTAFQIMLDTGEDHAWFESRQI